MLKEKTIIELKEEELEKVAGGTPPPSPPVTQPIIQSKNLYCPDCNFFFGKYNSSNTQWAETLISIVQLAINGLKQLS